MKQKLLKNVYATIAALFIALFAMPTTVQAEDYDLKICDQKVTSDNCNDLSVIDGVVGTVKYDPATKVLTLQEATISCDHSSVISSRIDGLTIKVIGENNLTAIDFMTLYLDKPLRIIGVDTGVLNLKNNRSCAIYAQGTGFTIENCTVNAEGKESGIEGSCAEYKKLTIRNSEVTAIGTKDGSIRGFGELNMKGCDITQPVGATYSESMHAVVLNGEIVKSKVVIQKGTIYDLQICGKYVTFANCNDLSSVIDGVSGTVKYNPDNKVLTLEDATISSSDAVAIISYIDDLTIKVIGENNLTTEEWVTVRAGDPLSIIGTGVLNVKSNDFNAIILDKAELTIENCTVNVEGKEYGIKGRPSAKDNKLTIKNATVTAVGTTDGSICNIDELDLEGCGIIRPKGATFDKSEHAVVLDGEIVKSKVLIGVKYDLDICGEYVTFENYNDLSSAIDDVSGTVKYDPDNKVLTLQDATISTSDFAIVSNIDGLTIKVIGENILSSQNATTILGYYPLSIIGPGELNLKSNNGSAIYAEDTDLTIENCTVNAEGKTSGIKGYSGNNEKFTIKNAKVTAIGTEEGSICDFYKLNLIGCLITEPAGAWFDESKQAVVLNGEIVKSKVVIEKDPAGVETPVTDNTGVKGIYTLSGIRLSGETEDLPKGIYIVNGKKVVKP
ncbi:MAG: DUF2436 domain-containing protein [Prevotella koreensis]|uniref:DUF2436 domain-containing protein n=1 Tax=Prevotella koreensis TaxID=2490854 RepID=UPI003F9EBB66